jgi:hypothetical protein
MQVHVSRLVLCFLHDMRFLQHLIGSGHPCLDQLSHTLRRQHAMCPIYLHLMLLDIWIWTLDAR